MVDTTQEKSRCIVYICDFSKYLEVIVSYLSKPQIWISLERSYKFYNLAASYTRSSLQFWWISKTGATNSLSGQSLLPLQRNHDLE